MEYRQVQEMARETIRRIRSEVKPGMTLAEVRRRCEAHMLALGADSFWYYDVGAFVFNGDETALSVSGRSYVTPDRILGENDILTIDLSPQCGEIWGDYARTLILQDGKTAESVADIRCDEWRNGLLMEEKLHEELFRFAQPDTTFEQLYLHMNAFIHEYGFVNLDFNGNLGHSIVRDKNDRIYIENGNQQCLGSVRYFTFEPHIGLPGSKYGFKKENIYFFENGMLKEL